MWYVKNSNNFINKCGQIQFFRLKRWKINLIFSNYKIIFKVGNILPFYKKKQQMCYKMVNFYFYMKKPERQARM